MFKKGGFTLLEILITIIILTGGVIALAGAFSAGLFSSTDVENVDLALNIAQARMEEIKNTPFASLADSSPTPNTIFPHFDVTVDVAEGQNPMRIDVTVEWDVKGGQGSIVLATVVTDLI